MDDGPCKPVDVQLFADAAGIQRGCVEPGERCEIVGRGPIPVTDARLLLNDATITTMVRDGTDIRFVSSPKRIIPAALRRWATATYPVCGVGGCDVDRGLEIDHIVPVEDHGPTEAENLWRLCHQHHILKTHCRWQVTGGPGSWDLIPPAPPDDPDPP